MSITTTSRTSKTQITHTVELNLVDGDPMAQLTVRVEGMGSLSSSWILRRKCGPNGVGRTHPMSAAFGMGNEGKPVGIALFQEVLRDLQFTEEEIREVYGWCGWLDHYTQPLP